MEAPAYGGEGGAGGKMRRRALRRAPAAATPYARPPTAARVGSRGTAADVAAPGGSRWFSKLVTPARFIAGSASWLFSSFNQKRLTAPSQAADPEVDSENRQEMVSTGSSSQRKHEDGEAASAEQLPDRQNTKAVNTSKEIHNPEVKGISEFEQLLKQKTFTRAEFDRVTEILRSRIISPDTSEPAVPSERLDASKDNPQETGMKGVPSERLDASKDNQQVTGMKVVPSERLDALKDNQQETGMKGPKMQGECSKALHNLTILGDEAASPAELAKAYMGSRSTKPPSSVLRLQNRAFYDEKLMSNVPKEFDPPIIPRSVVPYNDTADRPDIGYLTPRDLGKKANFRMSRSPYTRAQAISEMKGSGYPKLGSSTMFFHTPKSNFQSGGRQALKRRSSVLDNDIGSFGSVRQIRQRFSPISSIRGTPAIHVPPSPSTALSKDAISGFALIQRPPQLDEQNNDTRDLQKVGKWYKGTSYGNVNLVPPQSSQMAKKIFQELDKLVPSPKSSRGILNDSPIKLPRTCEDQAFRNTVNLGSLLNAAQDTIFGSVRDPNGSPSKTSSSPKQQWAKENGTSIFDVLGVKPTAEANSIHSTVVLASYPVPSKNDADAVTLDSHKKSAFQTTLTKRAFSKESNDASSQKVALGPKNPVNNNVCTKLVESKDASAKTSGSEAFMPSSMGIPSKFSKLGPVTETGKESTFPVSHPPSSYSQPPPAPRMTATAQQKFASPSLTFASDSLKVADTSTCSFSTADSEKNASTPLLSPTDEGPKFVLKTSESIDSKAKEELSTPLFAFGARKDEIAGKMISFKTFGNGDSKFSPELHIPVFTFGGKKDDSASLSFAAAGASKLTAKSTTSSSPSFSSNTVTAVPTLSRVKFGSTTLDKTSTTFLEGKPFKQPSSIASASSNSGLVSSTSLMVAPQFPSTGKCFGSAAIIGTSDLGSSKVLDSSLLSTDGGSLSVKAPSLAFSSLGKSSFMFGSSTRSSKSSSVNAESDSKVSAAVVPIFGFQASKSGSETSHFSQSSGSQPSSFSSNLVNASSPGFGSPQNMASTNVSKPFTSNPTLSFSTVASSSSLGISCPSSVQSSAPSVFGSAFGSSSAPSTVFSFGASSSVPGSSSLMFGSSSGSALSFPATSATLSLAPPSEQPVFRTTAVSFSSGSPVDDRMNVEDKMFEETSQAMTAMPPQQGTSTTSLFATSAAQPAPVSVTIFQFGSPSPSPFQSSVTAPSSPSPFQAAGNTDSTGGSFCLGSGGGGDKSGRRIIKVKHNRLRKK